MTAVPHAFERWRAQWTAQWRQRPPLARRCIVVLAALAVAAVLWLWIWQPLDRHLHRLRADLPAERAWLAEARRKWAESAGLQQAAPQPPATADTRAAVQRVAGRCGMGSVATLDVRENTATLMLPALPFDVLAQCLDALQREEHFYVVDATLSPLADAASSGGNVRAELVITRPAL